MSALFTLTIIKASEVPETSNATLKRGTPGRRSVPSLHTSAPPSRLGGPRSMTGVGLEPTTNGLTYPIGFRRPDRNMLIRAISKSWWSGLSHRHRRRAASSLWGWARRVRRSPCLLIAQSPAFSRPSRSPSPATLWCRGLSGCPSKLRHPLVAVRFLPARGSYFWLKSVALPTELPGQE